MRAAVVFAAVLCVACGASRVAPRAPDMGSSPRAEGVGYGLRPGEDHYRSAFDALHYAIRLDLTREEGIAARALVDVLVRGGADTLALDLSGMEVTGVRLARPGAWLEGEPAEVRFDRRSGKILIPLPAGVDAGDTLRAGIDYWGVPADGLIRQRTVHGDAAVFADNWPDRARYWIPSIDHPSDKATVAWMVRAPAGWEVVANGKRLAPKGAEVRGGALLWEYEMDTPVPTYTMVVGAADFAIQTIDACARGGVSALRSDGCVEVTAWTFPDDSANGARVFTRAGDMVSFYADLIAPFPYHKLAHVQSATRYGGMENAGAIFYAEEPLVTGADFEPTVAHETAHQWFGDGVTEGDWRHLWLSEGFATYFGALFFERADGRSRFRRMMDDAAGTYFESEVTEEPVVDTTRSATEDVADLLNANEYQKGAWVLHMARGLLGDSVFFEGVRRYYRSQAPGNALTEDLRAALESVSGRELGWFFDQWLYHPGYPMLRVAWRWDPGAKAATVSVEQTQPSRWPVFRFPLTLAFVTPRGEAVRTVQVTARRETLNVSLPAPPTALRVDPEGSLLARIEAVSTLPPPPR